MVIYPGSILRNHPALVTAYMLYVGAGILGLVATPSPTLARQGGVVLLIFWSIFCTLGGGIGLTGLFGRWPVVELIGLGFCSAVSLTWVAALVMQAVRTSSTVPLTAALVAGASTALLAQRFVDALRRPRE